MFEYTLRKNYPFFAGVPVPMFSNSCIYIITYILLNTCLFSVQHIWLFVDTIFFLFAINFILLLARDKTKKYLPTSQRIIKYLIFFLARACITVYQLMQDQCSHSDTPPAERAQKECISVKWITSSKLQNCTGMKYSILHAGSFILVLDYFPLAD